MTSQAALCAVSLAGRSPMLTTYLLRQGGEPFGAPARVIDRFLRQLLPLTAAPGWKLPFSISISYI